MEFEELKDVWLRGKELAMTRERASELERIVRRRDRLESGIALLLLPLFASLAVVGRFELSRVGAALLAVACVVIPLRLRAARLPLPDPSLPTAKVLRHELARVRAQQRLLRSVLWWYLAPIGLGVVLFVGGASPTPWLTGLCAALVVAFLGRLWRLNQLAVDQELRPRERELQEALAALDASE